MSLQVARRFTRDKFIYMYNSFSRNKRLSYVYEAVGNFNVGLVYRGNKWSDMN